MMYFLKIRKKTNNGAVQTTDPAIRTVSLDKPVSLLVKRDIKPLETSFMLHPLDWLWKLPEATKFGQM